MKKKQQKKKARKAGRELAGADTKKIRGGIAPASHGLHGNDRPSTRLDRGGPLMTKKEAL